MVPKTAKPPTVDPTLQEEYDALAEQLANAEEDRRWWDNTLTDHRFTALISRMLDEEDRDKERLVACKKAELDAIQARIHARKELLAQIEAKRSGEDIEVCSRRLQEFRKRYPVFLQDGEEGESSESNEGDDESEGGATVLGIQPELNPDPPPQEESGKKKRGRPKKPASAGATIPPVAPATIAPPSEEPRPCVRLGLEAYRDGNQWTVAYDPFAGDPDQPGIFGHGSTVGEAMNAFDAAFCSPERPCIRLKVIAEQDSVDPNLYYAIGEGVEGSGQDADEALLVFDNIYREVYG